MISNNTNRVSPQFKGGFFKLNPNKWHEAKIGLNTDISLEKVQKATKDAKDVVLLSVTSDKGRIKTVENFHNAEYTNTPIVLTDNEAKKYSVMTEKFDIPKHEALNDIFAEDIAFLEPPTIKKLNDFGDVVELSQKDDTHKLGKPANSNMAYKLDPKTPLPEGMKAYKADEHIRALDKALIRAEAANGMTKHIQEFIDKKYVNKVEELKAGEKSANQDSKPSLLSNFFNKLFNL